jgi:cytochrome c oxidase subunit 2
MIPTSPGFGGRLLPVGSTAGLPRSPTEQFWEIFLVFVVLGTLVGIVVTAYLLWKVYKYREGSGHGDDADVVRPQLGEIPRGAGGGKKLFLSFGISAVIVLSLIVWTYSALLYVEEPPEEPDFVVEVTGEQFAWQFEYPNGETTFNELRLPADQVVQIDVTASDVFHNFGIPAYAVKADAIPGQTSSRWFTTTRTGTFDAHCYELCGSGHSGMDAEVIVMEQGNFNDWYNGSYQASVDASTATAGGEA